MTESDLNNFILLSIAMIGLNAVAYYFFKLYDPTVEAQQQAQDLVDEVSDAALKNLNTPAERDRMIKQYSPVLEQAIMAQVASQIASSVGRYGEGLVITPMSVAPAPVLSPSPAPVPSPAPAPFPMNTNQSTVDDVPVLPEVSATPTPFQAPVGD